MIHPTAIIDPKAKVGKTVSIGAYSIIGPDVEIGEGTWIGSHAVVQGPTSLGKANKIFQFASIGEAPQDKKCSGELTRLEVGDRNIFREACTIHRGTTHGKGLTQIGNDNLFMAYTHVAHDCIIKNHVIFANSAQVAGHVIIHDYACLGGMVGIHQFCTVGAHSFIAGGSIVFKDVPPFVTVSGSPAGASGLNTVGLERRGYTVDTLNQLKRAYKVIFRRGNTVQIAVVELEKMLKETPEVALFVDALKGSQRGIVR